MFARTMQRAVVILAEFLLLAGLPAAAQNADPFQEAAPPVAVPPAAPPRARPAPAPPPEIEQPAPPSGSALPESAELVFWQSVSASNNPADFEEYLRKYPSGQFAGLARNRLAVLRPPPVAGSPALGAPQIAPGPSSAGYDGSYGGEINMVPGPNGSAQTFGRFGATPTELCDPASIDRTLEVRNGQFTFVYNKTTSVIVRGKVSGDGTLDALASSDYGGVRLTGRVQNNELTARLLTAACHYELRFRRR